MQTTYSSPQETLRAYLPATLVERWARQPQQSHLWGEWLTGSLMFCDISGFTAMSEVLTRLGKEGAELMAGVLNRFFETMLAIADGWGGTQMKFGGDAMLLLFSDEGHAQRAAAAGLDMQSAMAQFRRVMAGGDTYRLRMRIAIHSGRFFGASVGQPDGVLHYLLVGPDVNRTAEIEGAGEPGQVVVSAEAVALLGSACRLSPGNDGAWWVRRLEPPPRPARQASSLHPPVLQRYLLPPLAGPLMEGRHPGFSGEHRRVTAVFINLLGVSPLLETKGEAQALAQMDEYVRVLLRTLERYGGFLAGSDLAQEGDKLICLFGAPLSLEREEASALRTVIEFDQELARLGLDLRHRIGVSSGSVFAGEIGSSRRREYTVIGDSVNLAARLMAAAKPGEILVSKPTVERAASGFQVQRLRPLRLKGKAAPVPVFRLRVREERALLPEEVQAQATPLFGREEELAALLGLAHQVKATGHGCWAWVWGEPGIGKSRLTSEVLARLRAEGWPEVVASCQMHTSRTTFAAWRSPLRNLIGIRSDDGQEAAWEKLRSAVEKAREDLAPFASLLGELVSLPVDEDPSVASLDAKERRRLLTSLVVELLDAAARQRPLFLLFEDAHWADAPSLELLAAVLARPESALLAIVTSRQQTPPSEMAGTAAVLALRLAELPPQAARSLVASVSELADEDVERIIGKAQGNPLFLQEIARIGVVRGESLPETVNDVILARLDRMPPEEKTLLRLASVIGQSFSLEGLNALLEGGLDADQVEGALAQLGALGFTREEAGESPSYAFSHVLTREVAYETLPYAQRRQLHGRVAHHIEQREAARLEGVCELLLHHYEMAADMAKIVRYAAMSGDRAAALFATEEAMIYYQRSLAALGNAGKRVAADRSLLLERLGECLETAGRNKEAAQTFVEALTEWRASRHRPRLIRLPGGLRAREAALCRKVGVSRERGANYDEALRWLDEALAALPRRSGRVRAQICATKSLALFRKGLYEQAVHWGRMGLALSLRKRDLRDIAYARHILANSYMEMGNLKRALRHDRLSVQLYHELRDLPGQARANGNLGLTYQLLGVLDGALYHYEVSLKTNERVGNLVIAAMVHLNIAEVLLAMGRLEEAQAHLQEVVRAYQGGVDVPFSAGLAQLNLSRCHLAQGNLPAADDHLRRAFRLLRRVGAQGHVIEAALQRAELRLAQGRPQEALSECRRAMRVTRGLESRLLEARALRLLGRAEAALGREGRARDCLRASVALARRIGGDYEEGLSLLALARAILESPVTGVSATRTLRRAEAIFSRMGAEPDLEEARKLLALTGQR